MNATEIKCICGWTGMVRSIHNPDCPIHGSIRMDEPSVGLYQRLGMDHYREHKRSETERRFVIKEVTDSMLSYEDSLQQVTESELKLRLSEITRLQLSSRMPLTWDETIDILINGVKEAK